MRRIQAALLAIAVSLAPGLGLAQTVKRVPLPADHPLVGTWRIDLPQVNCHELYQIKADGTTQVVSGRQAAESEFELSARPGPRGFYKWVDKITRDNGRPDCMGAIMEVGHVATNFILLHPAGTMFLMCDDEDIDTCFGPFVRQEGI